MIGSDLNIYWVCGANLVSMCTWEWALLRFCQSSVECNAISVNSTLDSDAVATLFVLLAFEGDDGDEGTDGEGR